MTDANPYLLIITLILVVITSYLVFFRMGHR